MPDAGFLHSQSLQKGLNFGNPTAGLLSCSTAPLQHSSPAHLQMPRDRQGATSITYTRTQVTRSCRTRTWELATSSTTHIKPFLQEAKGSFLLYQ